jgi:hypothetical protein
MIDAIRSLTAERRAELYEERYGRRPPPTASSSMVSEAIVARLGDALPPELEALRPAPKVERRRPRAVVGELLRARGLDGATLAEIEEALGRECPWAKLGPQRCKQHVGALRKEGWDLGVTKGGLVRCFSALSESSEPSEEQEGGDDGNE